MERSCRKNIAFAFDGMQFKTQNNICFCIFWDTSVGFKLIKLQKWHYTIGFHVLCLKLNLCHISEIRELQRWIWFSVKNLHCGPFFAQSCQINPEDLKYSKQITFLFLCESQSSFTFSIWVTRIFLKTFRFPAGLRWH